MDTETLFLTKVRELVRDPDLTMDQVEEMVRMKKIEIRDKRLVYKPYSANLNPAEEATLIRLMCSSKLSSWMGHISPSYVPIILGKNVLHFRQTQPSVFTKSCLHVSLSVIALNLENNIKYYTKVKVDEDSIAKLKAKHYEKSHVSTPT